MASSTVIPYRSLVPAAAVATSVSSRKASSLTPHSATTGIKKPRVEVPLASQEGTKGVIQYALYVSSAPSLSLPSAHPSIFLRTRKLERNNWTNEISAHLLTMIPLYAQNLPRRHNKLGPPILPLAHDVRPRLLRRRDDASLDPALRSGPHGYHLPSLAPPVRRHDCGGHVDQQDGTCPAAGVRSDARPAMGHLDGIVCKWRGLLSL